MDGSIAGQEAGGVREKVYRSDVVVANDLSQRLYQQAVHTHTHRQGIWERETTGSQSVCSAGKRVSRSFSCIAD